MVAKQSGNGFKECTANWSSEMENPSEVLKMVDRAFLHLEVGGCGVILGVLVVD